MIIKQSVQDAHRINPEALRGAVALFVVLHHAIFFKQYLDPAYFPQWIAKFEPPGHFCVLIFFVLSGYVIGASNPGRLTLNKILPYLKKRFIRLYPIYFVALAFTLLIASPYPLHTVLTNFAIMQNTMGDVILENKPIWSLNYEVIYYLLFIPLSYFGARPLWVVAGSVLVGLLNYAVYPVLDVPVISAYAYGFAFWAAGWAIAVHLKNKETGFSYTQLAGGLFLVLSHALMSIPHYLADKVLFSKIHTNFSFPEAVDGFRRMVSFVDLFDIPYCLLLVVLFAGIKFKGKKYLMLACWLLPVLAIVQLLSHLNQVKDLDVKILSMLAYAISLLLYYGTLQWFEGVSKKVINTCIKLGTVSYGLYIFHFPLLVIFGKISAFSGSAASYAVRFVLYIALSLLFAFVLEKRFQVWAAARLRSLMMPEMPRPKPALLARQLRWLRAQV